MSHPFFRGVDWDAVRCRSTPLPLTPAYTQMTSIASGEISPKGVGISELYDDQPSIFDRFSPYVDGTNRYLQKQLLKQTLVSWMRYEINPRLLCHFDSRVFGIVPSRGIWPQERRGDHTLSGNGYFPYNSKDELIAHLQNERSLFPNLGLCLSQMSATIEEKTVLFEGDRCVCQWRIWGFL